MNRFLAHIFIVFLTSGSFFLTPAQALTVSALGGELTITSTSSSAIFTDLFGSYGVAGQQLRISSFDVDIKRGKGQLDFDTGAFTLNLALKLDFDVEDALSGVLITRNSFSVPLHEQGSFDKNTGMAVAQAPFFPVRRNEDLTVTAGLVDLVKKWLFGEGGGDVTFMNFDTDGLLNPLRPVTELSFLGGSGTAGEFALDLGPDFGNHILRGTGMGKIDIQAPAVPLPAGFVLLVSGICSLLVASSCQRKKRIL